jgi:hypothetical protein
VTDQTSTGVVDGEGERVLADAVEAYRVALGGRLMAAYALGSLAHGGFSELVSDIDLGLIISDPPLPADASMRATIPRRGGPTSSSVDELKPMTRFATQIAPLDTGAEKYEANATNFAVGAAEAVAGQAPRVPPRRSASGKSQSR